MLTRLRVNNLKRFDRIDIELGSNVVMIGPNNCGKTTALQALALWDIGLRRWNEKRKGKTSPEKRPGVAINRRDLVSILIPSANLLWRNLNVRDIARVKNGDETSRKIQNIRVEIIVDGVINDTAWSCGLEFVYANEESFYCKPLRLSGENERMPVPSAVDNIKIAFLPPMSGLTDREFIKQTGEIGVLIGQGQTAQVLRNLCFQLYRQENDCGLWSNLVDQIRILFGIELLPPDLIAERSEITMAYEDEYGNKLDLSSSGRGLQQTLLLLAYLYTNPGAVLLLDEPDAHLEILRQRQIYNILVDVAAKQNSQVIAASHSEVVLAEAAEKGTVIAFVGKPLRLNDRGSQLLKSLQSIGWDQYYQAQQTGWVLYLEGSTDLDILRSFAAALHHERAIEALARPFIHYLGSNHPPRSRDHFNGLREAKSDLVGVALFDRLDKPLQTEGPLIEIMWERREIENYFCVKDVLISYARNELKEDRIDHAEVQRRVAAMEESIQEITAALETLGNPPAWSAGIKATDDFLDPLFKTYFKKLNLPILMRKTDYHRLAVLLPGDKIDPEIKNKLDTIAATADRARINGA
ncbi:MAG: AAA family ATPase [Acidobacteria bacterium]|jgi:ABC-type taurine transport system ATPase subunit|nr:AAA family ATPase [Acidobacteriota bacterium]